MPSSHPDQLDHGRFISASDVSNKSRVAVVGSQVVTDLFGGLDPVGKSIKINGILFQVVGVMKSQGSGGFGFSRDTTTYVPITTAMARLSNARVGNQKTVSTIEVSATDSDSIDPAIAAITAKLRTLHKIGVGETDDFTVQSQTDILATATQVTGILTVFLGAIAGISLVVGGIGVMNIMLVSVTERTREIGLRKAVGARRSDILYQFLTETITLSMLGGIIGILIGAGISALVNASGVITTSSRSNRSCWPLASRRRSVSSSGFIRPIGRRASSRSKRCATNKITSGNCEEETTDGDTDIE